MQVVRPSSVRPSAAARAPAVRAQPAPQQQQLQAPVELKSASFSSSDHRFQDSHFSLLSLIFSLGESDSAIFRLIDIFPHSVDILLSICVTVIILLWGLRIRVAEAAFVFMKPPVLCALLGSSGRGVCDSCGHTTPGKALRV